MRAIVFCACLAVGLMAISLPAGGCGGGGGGAPVPGMPKLLEVPIKWIDVDGNGVSSPGDQFLLCFDKLVADGGGTPMADLLEAPASLAATDTWTNGPGAGKMTLTLVGGTLGLGKVGGSTIKMAAANMLMNPVDAMIADATNGPFSIMGNISNSGQSVGPASLSVALADMGPLDADMDIIVGTAGQNLIFTNTGFNSGTFVAGPVLGGETTGTGLVGGLASRTNGIAVGLINTLDIFPDVVALNGFPDLPLGSAKNRVYINTTGTPASTNIDNRSLLGAPAKDSVGGVISGFAAGLNWDGALGGDLFVANRLGQNLIYFSDLAGVFNGDGTLGGVGNPFPVGGPATDTRAVVGGNIDATADIDVITADDAGVAPGVITVYTVTSGAYPPVFTPATPAGTLPNPRALALCDLDNDGDLDLIVGYSTDAGGPGGLQVFSNAAGVFTLASTFGAGANVLSLACTQLDGDVFRDIVVGMGSNQGIQVWLNCAAFTFKSAGLVLPGNFNGLAATPTIPATGAAPVPQTGLDGKGLGDFVGANGAGSNVLYVSGQ